MPAPGTDKQALFALAYAKNGGNATAAALEAGYSEKSAADLGRRALDSPLVQEMIMVELTRQRARAGSIGLNALVEVAQSDKAPAPAKVAAGRALIEFAGLANAAIAADSGLANLGGKTAPDYKAILDTISNVSALAFAATRETIQ